MTIESYPNSAHNSRAVSLAEHEQILVPFSRSGFINYSATLPVYASASPRTVLLRANVRGTVRGTHFNVTAEHTVGPDQILANTSGSPRRDLLVMRLNREATDPNQFTIAPVVITGTPSATPVAPSAVRDDTIDGTGVWDLPVTEISVPNGASALTLATSDFRGWWVTPSGYTGLDTAKPPSYPGMIFRANDTGITYVGTHTGTWQRIYSNTGWVNLAAPSGWSAQTFSFARAGELVIMSARIVRTGATVAGTVSTTMATLAEQFRPAQAVYGDYLCSNVDNNAHVAIGTDGKVIFAGSGATALTIQQGATLFSNMVWLAKP